MNIVKYGIRMLYRTKTNTSDWLVLCTNVTSYIIMQIEATTD